MSDRRDPWETAAAIALSAAGLRAIAHGLDDEASTLLNAALMHGKGRTLTDTQWDAVHVALGAVDAVPSKPSTTERGGNHG